MNRPFTVDEEVIRRLMLRHDLHEQEHTDTRKRRLAFSLWRGFTGWMHHLPTAPRARWS